MSEFSDNLPQYVIKYEYASRPFFALFATGNFISNQKCRCAHHVLMGYLKVTSRLPQGYLKVTSRLFLVNLCEKKNPGLKSSGFSWCLIAFGL